MKEKLTLQEKLSRKKYKIPNRFIWNVLTKVVIKHFLAPKFNPTLTIKDDINKCDGPAFVIYNHQSRCDYLYINQLTYPRRLNYMVGYNEFFRSHLAFIARLMHFIPKKNFTTDLDSMRAMHSIIKQGGTVCFSPEGMSSITGHNQPVVNGTGKLLKKYGVPVYNVKLKGAFLSNTKACLDERKGKVEAELSLLFSKEDLEKMDAQEIEDKVNEAIWQDDYEWNKEKRIRFDGKGRIAHHIHDLCYRCPRCGEELQMDAHDDVIVCKKCGNGAHLNEMYDFIPFDDKCVIPVSISRWVDEERKVVAKEIRENDKYSFSEHVKLGELPKYKYLKNQATSELVGEGTVTINHEGFFYKGTRNNEEFEIFLNYEDIHTLVMVTDTSFFSVYYKGEYFDFFPDRASAMKCMVLVEEMHRMHVNKWKNFPWLNWIYED